MARMVQIREVTARCAVGAFDRSTCIGGVEVAMPLQRDTETLSVELGVPPSARGRGVRSALASYIESLAAHHDRTIVQAEVHAPVGTEFADTPGGRFALARGLLPVSTEDRFLLDLPYDERRIADRCDVADGYRITDRPVDHRQARRCGPFRARKGGPFDERGAFRRAGVGGRG